MGVGSSSSLSANQRTRSLEPPPLPAPPAFLSSADSVFSETNPRIADLPENTDLSHADFSWVMRRPKVQQVPIFYDSSMRKESFEQRRVAASSTAQLSQDSLVLNDDVHEPRITMEYSTQQERMEWSRTISNLAAANQQLASAYSCTLKHLEQLYSELAKGKTIQKSEYQQSTEEEEANEARTNRDRIFNKGEDDGGGNDSVVHRSNLDKRHLRRMRANAGRLVLAMKAAKKPKRKVSKQLKEEEWVELEMESRELVDLQKEIEDLKSLRSESQVMNARLMKDLEAQKQTVRKLMENDEVSKKRYEASLFERVGKLSRVSEQLNASKRENSRLREQLNTFQFEKATADERISNLEKELRDLRLRETTITPPSNCAIQTCVVESSRNNDAVTLDQGPGSISDDEFKKDLMVKREARQRALAAVSFEMDRLRRELDAEKVAHAETGKVLELLKATQVESAKELDAPSEGEENGFSREQMEAIRLTELLKMSSGLTSEIRFQMEKMDDLRYHLENQPERHKIQILALSRLAEETRETLKSRQSNTNVLKDRLSHVLVKLSDKTFLGESDEEIRMEHNRHLECLGHLRRLGEGRNKILIALTETAIKDASEAKSDLESAKKRHDGIEEELRIVEEKMDTRESEISNLESQLGLTKADCRDLQNQMSVINGLFTQMLLNASSSELDLDRLTQLLQENHDLISDMAKANNAEAAALPKLLLELIEQVDGRYNKGQNEKKEEEDSQEENIAHNLPKVWRVLMELLSCHAAAGTCAASAASSSAPDSCYKSVDTPTGPRLVISVSKTYIRLKELILEKKHLQKEMNRMKQLNGHLETKLGEQEKRLSTVSDELSKTWNIVGRMQAQHQQLHTHEQILRYELQQKRKMLQELKKELEYCREKWESARQKNTNTEIEWQSLRREFAARKTISCKVDSFNSGESGFSDERDDETDEDDVKDDNPGVGKRARIGSRKRPRKDDARAATPDTESEQATDKSKLSESKTPEIEIESNLTDGIQAEADATQINDTCQETEEIMDPLDMALTNVIENLIQVDDSSYGNGNSDNDSSSSKIESDEVVSASVFSIGPTTIPTATLSESTSSPKCSSFFGCTAAVSEEPNVSSKIAEKMEKTFEANEPLESNLEGDEESSRVLVEDNLDARAARLKRFEEQAEWLVRKMSATNRRGLALNSRLEELHEMYGAAPKPPAMPDVLPTFRIPTADSCSNDTKT